MQELIANRSGNIRWQFECFQQEGDAFLNARRGVGAPFFQGWRERLIHLALNHDHERPLGLLGKYEQVALRGPFASGQVGLILGNSKHRIGRGPEQSADFRWPTARFVLLPASSECHGGVAEFPVTVGLSEKPFPVFRFGARDVDFHARSPIMPNVQSHQVSHLPAAVPPARFALKLWP